MTGGVLANVGLRKYICQRWNVILSTYSLNVSTSLICCWHPWFDLRTCNHSPDNKVHGTNMGPTWVLSAPDRSHVGPMNLAIRVSIYTCSDEVTTFYKNIERHTAHSIVSWPYPKQRVIDHISDLMMIIRQSVYILSIIIREMGKLKTHHL